MASYEVDQKFLGRLAKDVEHDNPLLGSVLFKLLGLSLGLSDQLVQARRRRRREPAPYTAHTVKLFCHVVWLSREGLVLLEQYVLPMAGASPVLRVLASKLRASFYRIFVLFHPVVPPPPGFETAAISPPAAFLLRPADYLPKAHECFREAARLADELLWGSHSLRLSVKAEYAAFLCESVGDGDAGRALAASAVDDVYEAGEGIDNDMFADSTDLVILLGNMTRRGMPGVGEVDEDTPPGMI